jgi:hypothetical protein
MQQIDVIQRLKEIAERSPEEIGRAIAAAEKMSAPVAEASEAQKAAQAKFKAMVSGKKGEGKDDDKKTESSGKKPDADGDGVPDWADKKPGKDDNEDKKKVDEDVQITLSGSDAVLAEILKLAGQIGAKTTKGNDVATAPTPPSPTLGMPTPNAPLPALKLPGEGPMGGPEGPSGMGSGMGSGMPSSGPIPSLASMMGDEPDMGDEPMMDGAYDANTTPEPVTMGMDAAIPSGNDLSKPKITTPMTSPGNNPMHSSVSFD